MRKGGYKASRWHLGAAIPVIAIGDTTAEHVTRIGLTLAPTPTQHS